MCSGFLLFEMHVLGLELCEAVEFVAYAVSAASAKVHLFICEERQAGCTFWKKGRKLEQFPGLQTFASPTSISAFETANPCFRNFSSPCVYTFRWQLESDIRRLWAPNGFNLNTKVLMQNHSSVTFILLSWSPSGIRRTQLVNKFVPDVWNGKLLIQSEAIH